MTQAATTPSRPESRRRGLSHLCRNHPWSEQRHARGRLWLVAATLVIVAGCGAAGHQPAMTGQSPAVGGEAALGCDGLADRWAVLQQEYLDRLGTATVADLADASPAVASAGQWLANAMIEQTRDADAVGCADLVSGSSALCIRLGRLSAAGEAARVVLDRLHDTCRSAG